MTNLRHVPLHESQRKKLEIAFTPFFAAEFSLTSETPLGAALGALGPQGFETASNTYLHSDFRTVYAFMVPRGSPPRLKLYLIGAEGRELWYWLNPEAGGTVEVAIERARKFLHEHERARWGIFKRSAVWLLRTIFRGWYRKRELGFMRKEMQLSRPTKIPYMPPPSVETPRTRVREVVPRHT